VEISGFPFELIIQEKIGERFGRLRQFMSSWRRRIGKAELFPPEEEKKKKKKKKKRAVTRGFN
jgi:hypothetical protein